jgi:uncharacterized protein (DUF1501 family)
MFSRRDLLKAAPMGVLAPGLMGLNSSAATGDPSWGRVLIMIELKGGNDGLNTVIPYEDPLYQQFRPTIGLKRDQVLQMDEKLALHPALEDVYKFFRKDQCAVVLGTGYEKPNRSHFRSIDIWHTGSNSNEQLGEGWLARMFAKHRPPEEYMADGVVIGRGDAGPLRAKNPKVRSIVMSDPNEFVERGQDARQAMKETPKGALAHILGVENDLATAVVMLKDKLKEAPEPATPFPNTGIGNQMKTVAKMVAAKVPFAAIKVSQGGYDTHSGQLNRHQQLLGQLNGAIAAFQDAMNDMGKWDDVLIMTYSEFGRRVKENGSAGTDHGTAAPQFFIGGKVKGGLYGTQPELASLERGDLQFTTDYRCMYETVVQDWWNLGSQFSGVNPNIKSLGCIKS